ncbi:hypothetical protein CRE_29230 [Caenorhabditis remanei]|uniref:Uncharacterized protein n=1 Tax=Caenorhabditis remanei TaxID=31234 RepID=E3NKI3_CAERE|nr:hypothetical protein CRE_29230 [Caenorhabditis remanei]
MDHVDSQSTDTESVLLGFIQDCGMDDKVLDELHRDAQSAYNISIGDALNAQFENYQAQETTVKIGEVVAEKMIPVAVEEELPLTMSNQSGSNKKSRKRKTAVPSKDKKMKLSTDSTSYGRAQDTDLHNKDRFCERVFVPLKFWMNAEKRGRLVRGFDAQKIRTMSGLSVFEVWKERASSFPVIFVKDQNDMLRVIVCEGNHRVQSTITRTLTEEELTTLVPVYCIHLEEDFDALWSVAIPTNEDSMDACSTLQNLKKSLSREVMLIVADAQKIFLGKYTDFETVLFYTKILQSECSPDEYRTMQKDVTSRNKWIDRLTSEGLFPPTNAHGKHLQAPAVYFMEPLTRFSYLNLIRDGEDFGTNHCFQIIQRASVEDDNLTASVLDQVKNAQRGKNGLTRRNYLRQFEAIANGSADMEKIQKNEAITQVEVVQRADEIAEGDTLVFGRRVPEYIDALLSKNCCIFIIGPLPCVIKRAYSADVKMRTGTMSGSCFGLGGTVEYLCMGTLVVEDEGDEINTRTSTRIFNALCTVLNVLKKKKPVKGFVVKTIRGFEVKSV